MQNVAYVVVTIAAALFIIMTASDYFDDRAESELARKREAERIIMDVIQKEYGQ